MKSTISIYDCQIINLTKVYIDKMKYERLNDNFHYKITIFNNICRRVEVFDEVKIINFSIIVTDVDCIDSLYKKVTLRGT